MNTFHDAFLDVRRRLEDGEDPELIVPALLQLAGDRASRGLADRQRPRQLGQRLLWRVADKQPAVDPPHGARAAQHLHEQPEPVDELGLFLFTVRNGNQADLATGRGMLYAEKIMISRQDQVTPMHRHNLKAEDIINRGGGTLTLELFMPDAEGNIDRKAEVHVPTDGVARTMPAGSKLRLEPGESVTLLPGVWHSFWGEGADVLIGEVSTVNDDLTDNVFREPIGRFSNIDEDVAPVHLLVSDYEKWVG